MAVGWHRPSTQRGRQLQGQDSLAKRNCPPAKGGALSLAGEGDEDGALRIARAHTRAASLDLNAGSAHRHGACSPEHPIRLSLIRAGSARARSHRGTAPAVRAKSHTALGNQETKTQRQIPTSCLLPTSLATSPSGRLLLGLFRGCRFPLAHMQVGLSASFYKRRKVVRSERSFAAPQRM